MKRKSGRALLCGLSGALLLAGGAIALGSGDRLIAHSDLQNVFLPNAQAQMERNLNGALQRAYDQAAARIPNGETVGDGTYSADFQARSFGQGDTLELSSGEGILLIAGRVETSHSGVLIDVTDGVEIPSGATLLPGHRYLVGEDTAATFTVRSGAAHLGIQGSYRHTDSGVEVLPFVDVAEGDWFQPAVQYVCQAGLFSGISEDQFGPAMTMNRGMLVTVLYRLAGSPAHQPNGISSSFSDVAPDSWYAPYVQWGADQGVTAGVGEGLFAPEQSVTRQQVLMMLHSFAGQYMGLTVSGSADFSKYGDGWQVADWAEGAVAWALEQGLIVPSEEGTLRPGDIASRAEVATILMKFSALYQVGFRA